MGTKKVLIAEDELQNGLLLRRIIEKIGHQAKVLTDGREVLKLLEVEIFDLLIMDISMPVLDGIETAKQIRTNKTILDNNIPIILISGNDASYMKEVCAEVTANGYLCKPFELQNVIDKVEQIIK